MKDDKSFNSFIILWATQTLSRLGSSLTPFALVLWAYGQTGSALDTALLTVSSYLPYILLSLPVGALTDRLDKKRLILAADSLCALCTFMLFLSWRSSSLALWQLYLANAFSGLCQTFQQPASEVAVTLVTPADKYQKAGSMNALSNSLISMASPVIATALYSAGGLGLVIAADLSSFALAFISLILFVRIPAGDVRMDEVSISEGLGEAFCFLRSTPGILQVILFLAAINLIASVYNAALPALVLSTAGEPVLASVQASGGLAMILGSLAAAVLPRPRSRVAITASLFISMGTENFLLAFSREPVAWCIGAFLGWLCIPVMNTNLDALMRSQVPQSLQGRVYSARNMLQFFTIPFGYMLGGFLVDSVFEPVMDGRTDGVLVDLFGSGKGSGAAFLFSVIGVLGLLVCIVFSRLRAMRHLED